MILIEFFKFSNFIGSKWVPLEMDKLENKKYRYYRRYTSAKKSIFLFIDNFLSIQKKTYRRFFINIPLLSICNTILIPYSWFQLNFWLYLENGIPSLRHGNFCPEKKIFFWPKPRNRNFCLEKFFFFLCSRDGK